MANDPNLRVRISADLADIKQGLSLLRGELAKVKQQSAQAAPGSAWSDGLKSVRTQLAGIVSAYAALRAVRWYADVSDQASKLTGRLRLVTKTQEEFNRAYSGTYKLAQDSQADWQSVVNLFSQLTQTTGQSQERILNLSKIIGQAFRVSGASAQETSDGLRQLQQAIAGGTLRAEEFNTIIDTAPRIVQALADHFGISFGQVRKYVNDGKISSQEFMRALEEAADSIQSDFNKLPKTVHGSITQVRNALIGMVGDTNTATGASNDLAQGISDLAVTLNSPQVKQGFQSLVQGASTAVGWMAKLLTTTADVTKFVGEELAARISGPARGDTVRIEQALERMKKEYTAGGQSLYGDAPDPLGKLLGLKKPNTTGERLAEIKRLEQMLKLSREMDDAAARAAQAPAAATSSTGSNGTGTGTGTAAGKALAASNALQRDTVTRAIADLDRLYKASEIGTREYFANLTQLQQQAIDLQIQQARNELAAVEANSKGEKDKSAVLERRRKLEEEITILQRDRADVAKKNALDEQQAKDAMIDKLGDVKAQLADLDGDAGRAARIRIYAQFHDLFRQLEVDSDATGKALVQNLVDQLVDKAKLDAVRARVGEITTGLSSREQSISAQIQAGTLGQGEGERQLQDIRQKTLEQLREQRDLQLKILGDMSEGSPLHAQAVQALDEYNAAIANVTASQQKFRQQIEDQAVSSLGGFFDDLIEGAKSFKDAFLDMVRSFVAGVAKMIAQELALRAVRGILSMFGGGGGQAAYEGAMAAGAFNAKGNAFDSSGLRAFARGAVFPAIAAFAAGGAFTNQVVASPTLFAFGKGGQLGVMGEAGPEAIMPLERGPNGKLGVQAHGAGGAPQSIKVINVWSDDAAANAAAASPAWERVVINHVSNNRGALNGGG